MYGQYGFVPVGKYGFPDVTVTVFVADAPPQVSLISVNILSSCFWLRLLTNEQEQDFHPRFQCKSFHQYFRFQRWRLQTHQLGQGEEEAGPRRGGWESRGFRGR